MDLYFHKNHFNEGEVFPIYHNLNVIPFQPTNNLLTLQKNKLLFVIKLYQPYLVK